jgi:release factor glutamine methyltransferase
MLVEQVLQHTDAPTTIVECGVGTGAVLLSLMYEMPLCKGIGIDISEKAIEVCRQNAAKLNLNPQLYCMDMADFYYDLPAILVSNPPYLTNQEIDEHYSVLQYDPRIALYGGVDGLVFYRKIAEIVKRCAFTAVYLEAPSNRAEQVREMFSFHLNVHIIS